MKLRYSTITIVIVAFSLTSLCGMVKGDTVYNIIPQSLSNGYELVGGTITTDDTVGAAGTDFEKANILDYEVEITGPINFTFHPGNPNARVFNLDVGVIVTNSQIYVEAQPQSAPTAELRFEARDTLPGNFSSSIQQVFWNQGGNSQLSRVGWGDSSGPLNQGTNSQPMLDRLVIATTAIPEPGSAMFLLAVITAVAVHRYR